MDAPLPQSPQDQTAAEWVADLARAEMRLIPGGKAPDWISSAPPADNLVPESFRFKGLEPVARWTYHGADGAPIGYVCRYQTAEGKKLVLQWTYGRLSDAQADQWSCKHFTKPLPLYNLHEAVAHPERQLVVVEGEKCADAAARLLPNQVVLAWPGGANAVRHVDWSPLGARERKKVFLWPDCDDAGRGAMAAAGDAFYLLGYDIVMVEVDGKPQGWDVADAVEEGLHLPSFIRDHARVWTPSSQVDVLPPDPEPEPEPEPDPEPAPLPHQPVYLPAPLDARDDPPATTEQPPPEDHDTSGRWRIDTWQALGLELASGKPIDNVSNVALVLEREYAGRIWYDQFLQKILTRTSDGETTREWSDADDVNLLVDLQRRCGMAKTRKGTIQDAVVLHALKDLRSEVSDYLETLQWDCVPRIGGFFERVCGAEGSSYTTAVSRNFFISLVARAFRPGCKVDTMVVLEGVQGAHKSMLCEILGGRWHTVMRSAPTSKDFEITLQGKWLIEVAEFDSFNRADVSATKRTLSTSTDRYRPPYGRHALDHPRRSVFVATVNRDDYSTDETGARRLWPIACTHIDVDQARLEREQLLAEAVACYRAGATWWEVPEAEAREQQGRRYSGDVWTDAVLAYAEERAYVTSSDLLGMLGVELERQGSAEARRVGAILRAAGWVQRVQHRDGSRSRRIWARGAAAHVGDTGSGSTWRRPEPPPSRDDDDRPPVDAYDDAGR